MTPTGGMIGLFYSLKARALAVNKDSAMMSVFVTFVVGAAVLSILEATIAKAPVNSIAFWKFGLLGMGCVLAELMGLKRAIIAFHDAKVGQTVAWSAIWACGFLAALWGATTSAANNSAQRANVQKASYVSYEDGREAVIAARKRVAMEEKGLGDVRVMGWQSEPLVDGRSVSSVDAAQALIKGYEGNTRFFKELTKGCTDANGPAARKFCANLTDARAAEKDLAERVKTKKHVETMEGQLATARAALDAAVAVASATQTVTSDVNPMVHFVSTRTGQRPEEINWIEPAFTASINMMLVSFAGFAMGLAHISGKPRTPVFGGAFGRLMRGRQSAEVPRVQSGVPSFDAIANQSAGIGAMWSARAS